ncbi:MAG: hypothetical protein O3C21_10435 [Verrucomicrobia bacterium]|nr:hypothetical protein [Verrucomicrobiota bacterium]
MISDLEFDSFDSEVDQLFRDAVAEANERGIAVNVPDEARVERIVEKAMHEAVIKDTATFFFRSFAAALAELLVAMLRAFIERNSDVKVSEDIPSEPPLRKPSTTTTHSKKR